MPEWISQAQPIVLEDGQFALELATASGIQVVAGELLLKLITDAGLELTASGLGVDLATDPGLEFSSGDLRVKVKSGGGITRDSNGLSVNESEISVGGGKFTLTALIANGATHNASVWECVRADLVRGGTHPTNSIVVNLPALSDVDDGDEIIVKRPSDSGSGGNNRCVVTPNGTDRIDHSSTYTIQADFERVHLMASSGETPNNAWMVLDV